MTRIRNCALAVVLYSGLVLPAVAWPSSPGAGEKTPAFAAPQRSSQDKAQNGSAEGVPVFRSHVNLVVVPVVVRDSQGNAIGNLRRENFRVLDNGKPQTIRQFSIETPGTRADAAGEGKTGEAHAAATKAAAAPVMARRFIAYVFDDLHLDRGDFMQARTAAVRQLASVQPEERVALYTTSGHQTVEFTGDVAKVREALLQMMPRSGVVECPELGPLWAGQIEEAGYQPTNPIVASAISELSQCPAAPEKDEMKLNFLRGLVSRIVAESERDSQVSVAVLRNVVARMTALPGERAVVTISSGFLTRHQQEQLQQVIDRAVQARVAVNTLDVRGVYTSSMFDASSGIENAAAPSSDAARYRMEAASVQQDVLQELADGTGGLFFHSNNDMFEGFRRTAGVAEYTYMIGFTPEVTGDPKADPYHKLKVTLEDAGRGLSVQARRGYMADTKPVDPEQEKQQQIRTAMYSREEMTDIPMKLRTEVSKAGDGDAMLKVTVQLDLQKLPAPKTEGRSSDDLEIHAGVFDRNGKYITGKGNKVELQLPDPEAEGNAPQPKLPQDWKLGLDFNLKPGEYVVRVVVREADNQLMAAGNSTVQIQ